MATTIKLKNSVTTTNAPSSLAQGEVAINITDKKVWVGNAATTPIQLLGAGASMSFGALTCTSLTNSGLTSGRVTYASTNGLLADSANFTFNGTTVTMANDASISGLTVGKGGGSVSSNTAVGLSALTANTSGSNSTAFGNLSLLSQTSGGVNTAVGDRALTTNTTGSYNTGIGVFGLRFNTTGTYNSALGVYALEANTTGGYNTAIGSASLASNTTASNNTAVGYQALYTNSTGANNTALGYRAGYTNTTGERLAAFGRNSLLANTTGVRNSAFGMDALTTNSTGSYNSAVGTDCLASNTTGSYNTAIGNESLYSNTTASNNTAVGYQAGYSNTTGTGNTAIGYQALYTISTTNNNTAIGFEAGKLSTGTSNTFVGRLAGSAMTTGTANTIIGRYNGNEGSLDIRTASNYIVLSDGDGNIAAYKSDLGDFYIGGATTRYPGSGNTGNGFMVESSQRSVFISRGEAPVLYVNRNVDDGTLVRFSQAGTEEGSISVSGSTVSYNGGHLSRWSQWQNQTGKPEVYRGTVLESTNDMCEWNQPNEQSTKTIVSITAKSKAVAGVFDMYDIDDEDNPYDFYVAQSGDFVIRIAQGVVVENGDLLESAGDGTARPQTDDICRSSTIAKVTSNYVSTTYADGSYCVPCILMIG